ncbi:OpgC domain-containing protein [Caldimonas tepidiphila]|uniref:OpgC domain-containing protein n=1 Tax=Caldimonas tepidiphila TaxID=2315841 RepID=UPI000E5B8C7E|nr:OpgC domain-containing protein [Caldimonas tepidiphila]
MSSRSIEKILPLSAVAGWRYAEPGNRDQRLDFMRGFVFLMLFTTHFKGPTWMVLVGWERFGVVSSAETFIILAGVVTGVVYGSKMRSEGLEACTQRLWQRAWELYKIALLVAGSIALLRLVPGLETGALTSFTDLGSGTVYPLYPPPEAGILRALTQVALLKAGPHQFQIVGLYVVLFLSTPAIFWAIGKGQLKKVLALSWLLYFIILAEPAPAPGEVSLRLTGAQFEYAFPLLAWQLPFVHGIAFGIHKKQITEFFRQRLLLKRVLVAACVLLSLGFALFSINHPLENMPHWARLNWIPPDTFGSWYQAYFMKNMLGIGRLFNNLVLLVASHALLTVAWVPIKRLLGWLFVPLGAETMYVFIMHVYLILLVINTPLPALNDIWVNTAVQVGALLACWAMVRTRFLFRWIPH